MSARGGSSSTTLQGSGCLHVHPAQPGQAWLPHLTPGPSHVSRWHPLREAEAAGGSGRLTARGRHVQVDPECTRGLCPFGREGGRRRTRGPSGCTAQNQQLMALSGYASAHGGPEPGALASAARGYSVILRGSDLSQKYRTTLRNFPEVCLLLPELLEMLSPGACRCGAGILHVGEGGRDWGTATSPGWELPQIRLAGGSLPCCQ